MTGMEQLIAELKNLVARHATSPNTDFYALLGGLNIILERAAAAPVEYQYRHHPKWDTTWLDLDESQIAVVLEHCHNVERRQIAGGWETVEGSDHVSD